MLSTKKERLISPIILVGFLTTSNLTMATEPELIEELKNSSAASCGPATFLPSPVPQEAQNTLGNYNASKNHIAGAIRPFDTSELRKKATAFAYSFVECANSLLIESGAFIYSFMDAFLPPEYDLLGKALSTAANAAVSLYLLPPGTRLSAFMVGVGTCITAAGKNIAPYNLQ